MSKTSLHPLRALLARPGGVVVVGFAVAVAVGTALLMLPVASESGQVTGLKTALFTAVSAVCVTGLIVVDTPDYWSAFGEVVIVLLIQIGGIGIMTLATLLGLLVLRRVGLRLRRSAQTETKTGGLGDVRAVVLGVLATSLLVELLVAIPLVLRFALHYRHSWAEAGYLGAFHAVSGFNNAGFALFSDSMIGFATDPWISLPIALASILGGLGFPVLLEVAKRARGYRRRWSLHLRITVLGYLVLLIVGIAAFVLGEWANPRTLGGHGIGSKLLIGFFHGVMPRTAGFNSVDVGQMDPATLFVTDVLMFIGGGSAGTAGGIKVTTFALLGFVMWAEVRGEPTVHVLGRRLPAAVQRQALTVALAGVGLVAAATVTLLSVSTFGLDAVLFEATSAFGTVGLSTGITARLPATGQLVLVVLMFVGRLGPITLASALALRERGRRYERPEERTIVG